MAANSIKIAVFGLVWWSFWEVFEVLVGVSGDVEEGLQGQFWEGQGQGETRSVRLVRVRVRIMRLIRGSGHQSGEGRSRGLVMRLIGGLVMRLIH